MAEARTNCELDPFESVLNLEEQYVKYCFIFSYVDIKSMPRMATLNSQFCCCHNYLANLPFLMWCLATFWGARSLIVCIDSTAKVMT